MPHDANSLRQTLCGVRHITPSNGICTRGANGQIFVIVNNNKFSDCPLHAMYYRIYVRCTCYVIFFSPLETRYPDISGLYWLYRSPTHICVIIPMGFSPELGDDCNRTCPIPAIVEQHNAIRKYKYMVKDDISLELVPLGDPSMNRYARQLDNCIDVYPSSNNLKVIIEWNITHGPLCKYIRNITVQS